MNINLSLTSQFGSK